MGTAIVVQDRACVGGRQLSGSPHFGVVSSSLHAFHFRAVFQQRKHRDGHVFVASFAVFVEKTIDQRDIQVWGGGKEEVGKRAKG